MSDEAAVREWRPDAEPWEALSEADRRYDGTPEPMFSREFWEGIVGRLSGMGWRLTPESGEVTGDESDDWRDGYNRGYKHGWDQSASEREAELEAENKRLRELAGEAIEYVPSYFREKWGMDEELASVPVPESDEPRRADKGEMLREHIQAGNALDEISVPRSECPGRTMQLPERVRWLMSRYLGAIEDKRRLQAEVNELSPSPVLEEPEGGWRSEFTKRLDALESEVRDARTNASGMSGYFTLGGRLDSMQRRIYALESPTPSPVLEEPEMVSVRRDAVEALSWVVSRLNYTGEGGDVEEFEAAVQSLVDAALPAPVPVEERGTVTVTLPDVKCARTAERYLSRRRNLVAAEEILLRELRAALPAEEEAVVPVEEPAKVLHDRCAYDESVAQDRAKAAHMGVPVEEPEKPRYGDVDGNEYVLSGERRLPRAGDRRGR